jgi:hypothetical protein
MSIQPNRVIHRIVAQVDESDWPSLPCRVLSSPSGGEMIRLYETTARERYATPLHFWVHALRDELAATERRDDLIGAAGHAMCLAQPLGEWLDEIGSFSPQAGAKGVSRLREGVMEDRSVNVRVYRMLASECRRSSVFDDQDAFVAHFWGHGSHASWRRSLSC